MQTQKRDWHGAKHQWKVLLGTESGDENAEGNFQTATMKAFNQLKYICMTSEINSVWNHYSFIEKRIVSTHRMFKCTHFIENTTKGPDVTKSERTHYFNT